MKTVKALIKRHLLLSYFTLVFALSWGAMLLVVGPGGFLGIKEIPEVLEPFLYVAMLLGPSVAGIVLTGLLYGRAGLRDLLTRMTRWRVGARWYAVALLTAPLSMMAVLFALSLTSPVFLPSIIITADKASVLLMGIAVGLMVGIFEELGWTGFAIPTLLRLRHGILSSGLIVGVLWGAWHFPLFSGSGSSSGALPPALYLLVLLFSVLPAFRVLMVWVYERTNGSLLVAMLMHTSLTASTLILMPLASGVAAVTYDLVLAAALWVFVGAVALANGGHLSRQPPLRKRVA